MGWFAKKLYLLKRLGNSLFTYNCVSCKKYVQGKCICDSCSEKLMPVNNYMNGFAFAYYYRSPAAEVLLKYKFGKDYEFCYDTLCDWLLMAYNKLELKKIDAVVPVPSFERKDTRLSQLCKKFALMAELPFCPDLLHKIRKTEKQHYLSSKERRLNVMGAFEAENSVCGKTVLLVDDVFTTGSTVAECINALYDKGAKKVYAIAALKTLYD